MSMLIPLRSLLLKILEGLKLPANFKPSINCQIFEDNSGALKLATKPKITNQTKYFLVKWHFFWSHLCNGLISMIHKIDTQQQHADYLTKGPNS
jgi:hypothetical protein